jgi:hypothetical protein
LCATNGSTSGKEIKTNYIVVTLQTIVQTNLQAHYKALVGATPPNATLVSGAISQWDDESGNAFHLGNGTAVQRPLYNETALTAPDGTIYGSSDSDGSNDNLFNSNALLTRLNNHCCYILMKQNNFISAVRTFLRSTTGSMLLQIEPLSTSFRICNVAAYNSSIRDRYCLVKATFSSTNAAIQINDGNNIDTGSGSITEGNGFAIGASANTSGGSVIECALYSNIPSAGDDIDIINYFNSKFGGVICS